MDHVTAGDASREAVKMRNSTSTVVRPAEIRHDGDGSASVSLQANDTSTRLVQKRREMHKVQQRLLEVQRKCKERHALCRTGEAELKDRDLELQQKLVKYSKFLHDNDSKTTRAERKAAEQIKLAARHDADIVRLGEEQSAALAEESRLSTAVLDKRHIGELMDMVTEHLAKQDVFECTAPADAIARHRSLTALHAELSTGLLAARAEATAVEKQATAALIATDAARDAADAALLSAQAGAVASPGEAFMTPGGDKSVGPRGASSSSITAVEARRRAEATVRVTKAAADAEADELSTVDHLVCTLLCGGSGERGYVIADAATDKLGGALVAGGGSGCGGLAVAVKPQTHNQQQLPPAHRLASRLEELVWRTMDLRSVVDGATAEVKSAATRK